MLRGEITATLPISAQVAPSKRYRPLPPPYKTFGSAGSTTISWLYQQRSSTATARGSHPQYPCTPVPSSIIATEIRLHVGVGPHASSVRKRPRSPPSAGPTPSSASCTLTYRTLGFDGASAISIRPMPPSRLRH